jgi:hypothetical protein
MSQWETDAWKWGAIAIVVVVLYVFVVREFFENDILFSTTTT